MHVVPSEITTLSKFHLRNFRPVAVHGSEKPFLVSSNIFKPTPVGTTILAVGCNVQIFA